MRPGTGGSTMEALMDVGDLARVLKRPKSWVYENYLTEGIPHTRVGGGLRFRPSRIERWLDARSA